MVRVKQPGRCEPALRAGVPTYCLHYTHARLGAWEAASKCLWNTSECGLLQQAETPSGPQWLMPSLKVTASCWETTSWCPSPLGVKARVSETGDVASPPWGGRFWSYEPFRLKVIWVGYELRGDKNKLWFPWEEGYWHGLESW